MTYSAMLLWKTVTMMFNDNDVRVSDADVDGDDNDIEATDDDVDNGIADAGKDANADNDRDDLDDHDDVAMMVAWMVMSRMPVVAMLGALTWLSAVWR